MTGIVGFVCKRPADNPGIVLKQMLGCMMHESFYNSGTLLQEELGLGVGWVCHKGSFSDCIPIWNRRKDICLVFSGEHFAGRAGDASGLVHLYEGSGERFFETLNGTFSGVVVDLRERKAVLFNDRYGLGRIYLHQNKDGFYFASEAKSLLKVFPQLRRLDLQGLGEFCSCGCVLQNRTVFSGISILPGGARWTFLPDGSCRKESYFTPSVWENQPVLSGREYSAQLAETFSRILPPYLNGRQRVGMSMTGGIDSRLILAWGGYPAGSLPCYTFGGSYRDCADVRLARRLAKVCGLPHQTIPVGEEFLREFPALAERTVYLSDGTMDVSGAVELYVNRIAREIAPVRLTGNYGSEILRSHVAFKPGKLDQALFDKEFGNQLHLAEATYASERQCRPLSFIAFKQVPWHHYARSSIEQTQLTVRSPYLDKDLVKLAYQAPPEMATGAGHLLQLISQGNPALGSVGTDRALRERSIPLASCLLNRFQEFTAKAEYAYDYGMPQWLAKVDHVFAQLHLEKLFLGRHKFYHFRVWYRDSFAKCVREVLLDARALGRPWFNRRRLEELVGAHTSGTGNYTLEIQKALSVELLQRSLIEQN